MSLKQNRCIKYILPLLTALSLFLIVLSQQQFVMGSDDEKFLSQFTRRDFSSVYGNNRILINYVTILTIGLGINVWKIINCIAFLAIVFYAMKISEMIHPVQYNAKYYNSILVYLFFLVPVNVISSGLLWPSGSFNYAWGTAGCLAFVFPFIKRIYNYEIKRKDYMIAFLSILYAGNIEQTSAVCFCFSMIVLAYCFYRDKKVEKKLALLSFISLCQLLLLIFLPFNKQRMGSEAAFWYPDFEMLSLVDKLYQGLVNLYVNFIFRNIFLFTTCAVLLTVIVFKREKSVVLQLLSLFSLAYMAGYILIRLDILNGKTIETLYSVERYHYQDYDSLQQYVPFILCSSLLIITGLLLVEIMHRLCSKIIALLFYLAALASVFIMSFTPTIFASGRRTFFLADIFFWILTGVLIRQIDTSKKERCRFGVIIAVLYPFFAVLCLELRIICKGVILY